jgi:hypothetical protein
MAIVLELKVQIDNNREVYFRGQMIQKAPSYKTTLSEMKK